VAELPKAPKDKRTGMPLLIVPPLDILEFDPEYLSEHHPLFPDSLPALQTVGGKALKFSQVQIINKDLHNHLPGTFHSFYGESEVTEDEDTLIEWGVLIGSGYIAEEGVDLSNKSPVERPMSRRELEVLRAVDPASTFGYKTIQNRSDNMQYFFGDHILRQDITHAGEQIDRFIDSTDPETKIALGRVLLEECITVAAEKIEPTYQELRHEGRLHPYAHSRAWGVIHHILRLDKPERQAQLVRPLERRLKMAIELT
jgi:hypothetical protein